MKKIILALFLLLFIPLSAFSFDDDLPELRNFSPLVLQKGTFIKIVNQRMISTATADEGDEITFIVPNDVWCGESKVVPKESIFSGYIEELNEPVQGTNAALKLKITKLTLPNKTEFPVDAYVTYKGEVTIGGELTPPLEYARMPHFITYPHVHRGVLQYVPGPKRFFGNHLVIKSGAELVLVLNENFNAIVVED